MNFKHLVLALIFIPITVHSSSDSILKEIFNAYRDANNRAFVTDDNTHIKKLYSGNIDSCWIENDINYNNPVISLQIPDDAKYSLTGLKDDESNPFKEAGFIFLKEPTHKLDISYKKSYFSTCSNSIENPTTSIATYISLNNSSFTFPGMCPSKDLLEYVAAKEPYRLMSQPFISHVLNNLTKEEKNIIKQYAKRDGSAKKYRGKMNTISKKYRMGPATRREVKYELCKK